MWKTLLLIIALSLFSGQAGAESRDDLESYLRSDHPDVYVVRKGDTLWDISGRFLTAPWLWPELWRHNTQIENPHLIYPGDKIRFGYVDGQPALMLERGAASRTVRLSPGVSKLEPRIRSEPLESAIPAISLDAIRGFLTNSRVVMPGELEDAPYVVQGESRRIVLGAGDRFYAVGDLTLRGSYSIVRDGPVYVDPETDEVLGQEATDIATGQVTRQEAGVSTLVAANARQEVRVGDRLLPTEERRVQSTFYPKSPSVEVLGQIINVAGGVGQVGQFNVVVLNRGAREGIEEGDVLAIYRRGDLARDPYSSARIRLPSERAGLLMVFRVFDRVSYGFVLRTQRQLSVYDEVRNP